LLKYRIFETNQYLHDLDDISKNIQKKIIKKINNFVFPQLSENPSFGNNIKKLKNYAPETWRYRIGNFRMFYEIDEDRKVVSIIGIDMRKDAY